MPSYYVPDELATRQFLGWTGPIGADLRRRGRTLEFRGRSSAPFRTGKIRIEMKTIERTVVDGLQIDVGNMAGPDYANAQHEGAGPHIITPRQPGGRLVFRVGTKLVFARSVHHPGNPATHYLSRWLREAAR